MNINLRQLNKNKIMVFSGIAIFLFVIIPNLCSILSYNSANSFDQASELKTSQVDISNIEFVQENGSMFYYDDSDYTYKQSFGTGQGVFELRIYTPKLQWNQRFKVELNGYAPYFKLDLTYDITMLDEIPLIGPLLGPIIPDVLVLKLVPESSNSVTYYLDSDDYNSAEGYYSLKPSPDDQYIWKPQIFLGDIDISFALPLVEVVLNATLPASFNINDIKYDITNKFKITAEQCLLGFWIFKNNINFNYKGTSVSYLELNIYNDDFLPPTCSDPKISKSFAGSNFEIVVDIEDEEFGSGVDERTVYLAYSVNGGGWRRRAMLLFNDSFYGDLPQEMLAFEIQYYIEYEDFAGNVGRTPIYLLYTDLHQTGQYAIPIAGGLITLGIVGGVTGLRYHKSAPITEMPRKKRVESLKGVKASKSEKTPVDKKPSKDIKKPKSSAKSKKSNPPKNKPFIKKPEKYMKYIYPHHRDRYIEIIKEEYERNG